MSFDPFEEENKVITRGETLLTTDNTDFRQEYEKLLGAYRSIFKGFKRVVKQSDRSEEKLKHGNLQLKKANELAENTQRQTSEFVAMISHELRTPLAILRSEVELLQDGIRQPTAENLASLNEEVQHFSHLIDDMFELTLSDIGQLTYDKRSCDLIDLLERTTDSFEKIFNKRDLKINFDKNKLEELDITIDPQRIKQVFSNIIKNSSNYTDAGGELRISLELDNEFCWVTMEDSAPGVSDEALSQLFNRFFREEQSRNRSTGGAGLGLSICQSILTEHQGRIAAEHSQLGGVLVRIGLPLIPGLPLTPVKEQQ